MAAPPEIAANRKTLKLLGEYQSARRAHGWAFSHLMNHLGKHPAEREVFDLHKFWEHLRVIKADPEEYAARFAHLWGCFSLHEYRYHDTALGAWVRRLGEIFFTDGEVERCRQHFLTPGELARVQEEEAQGF